MSLGEGSSIQPKGERTVITFSNNTANNRCGAIDLRIDPASYLRYLADGTDV